MTSGIDHKVTSEKKKLVAGLAVLGHTKEYIAKRLNICAETLNKYYRYELEDKKNDVDCNVVDKLLDQALDGNLKAIMFYLTHRCGWAAAKVKDDNESINIKSLAEAIMLAKEAK